MGKAKGTIVWTVFVAEKEYVARCIKTGDNGPIHLPEHVTGTLEYIQEQMKKRELTRFPPLANDHFSVVEMWM